MHTVAAGIALTGIALVLVASATGSTASSSQVAGCAKATLPLKTPGVLTLATDNPARRPWWNGTPVAPWKTSNPASGKGYESAVAYAVAKRLGFSRRQVTWAPLPASQALQPGSKTFDFYIGQAAYSQTRDRSVDFSNGYYLIPMALLSRAVYPVSRAKTLAAVRPAYLGVANGTAGHKYTVRHIKPNVGPTIYDTYDNALLALASGRQATGVVVDLPTAYLFRSRVAGGVVVGQFPNKGSRDRFALVFEQGSKLRYCVNKALGQLWARGTIKALQAQWLTPAGGGRVLR